MLPNRHSKSLGVLAGVFFVLAASAATHAQSAGSERRDPLALGKLAQETLSVKADDWHVASVFELLSKMGQVPFVLEFEPDPYLKVSFAAENMPLRAVLASLAETYGFDYAASDEGIIVRQRGKPASGKRTTIGVWPPRPGPIYQLEFQVRVDSGTPFPGLPTLNTIPMEIPTRTLLSVKQGRQGMKEVTILDRNLLVAERRGVGAVVLSLCINKETSAGLDLLMEIVSERVVAESRYVEDRTFVSKTVPKGETLLFATDDGIYFVLKSWTRKTDKRSDAGEGAAPRPEPQT